MTSRKYFKPHSLPGSPPHHPILDLHLLNGYFQKLKFRLDSLASIILFLDPKNWYATLDLKDVYFHISILQGYRRFLRFVVNQMHDQFAVLPFGSHMGIQICMVVVVAF